MLRKDDEEEHECDEGDAVLRCDDLDVESM